MISYSVIWRLLMRQLSVSCSLRLGGAVYIGMEKSAVLGNCCVFPFLCYFPVFVWGHAVLEYKDDYFDGWHGMRTMPWRLSNSNERTFDPANDIGSHQLVGSCTWVLFHSHPWLWVFCHSVFRACFLTLNTCSLKPVREGIVIGSKPQYSLKSHNMLSTFTSPVLGAVGLT